MQESLKLVLWTNTKCCFMNGRVSLRRKVRDLPHGSGWVSFKKVKPRKCCSPNAPLTVKGAELTRSTSGVLDQMYISEDVFILSYSMTECGAIVVSGVETMLSSFHIEYEICVRNFRTLKNK